MFHRGWILWLCWSPDFSISATSKSAFSHPTKYVYKKESHHTGRYPCCWRALDPPPLPAPGLQLQLPTSSHYPVARWDNPATLRPAAGLNPCLGEGNFGYLCPSLEESAGSDNGEPGRQAGRQRLLEAGENLHTLPQWWVITMAAECQPR